MIKNLSFIDDLLNPSIHPRHPQSAYHELRKDIKEFKKMMRHIGWYDKDRMYNPQLLGRGQYYYIML